MNKSELQSKSLSELHTLAAEAGVERFRMLPRAELIDALADGSGGGGGGGGERRPRQSGGRESGSGRRDSRGRGRGGGGRESRGGRDSRGGGREPRGGRDSGGGKGSSGGRDSGGGGRESGGGGRDSGGGGRERRPRREEPRSRPEREEREPAPRAETPAPTPGSESSEKPKRRRRRRRFGRRGGKTVHAHEMLMPEGTARQALVYAETRETATSLLRELAADLSGGRGADPVALLVDPSPEELADWKREAPKAELVSAGQERHAEDAVAQAVRRAESGEAVVLLIDSLTRVAEEFGGSKAAKELFDSGLSTGGAGSGSLTVIAAVERSSE